MGPLSFMRSFVDRNFVMRRTTVFFNSFIIIIIIIIITITHARIRLELYTVEKEHWAVIPNIDHSLRFFPTLECRQLSLNFFSDIKTDFQALCVPLSPDYPQIICGQSSFYLKWWKRNFSQFAGLTYVNEACVTKKAPLCWWTPLLYSKAILIAISNKPIKTQVRS